MATHSIDMDKRSPHYAICIVSQVQLVVFSVCSKSVGEYITFKKNNNYGGVILCFVDHIQRIFQAVLMDGISLFPMSWIFAGLNAEFGNTFYTKLQK